MKIIISVLLAFAQVFGFFQAAVLRLSPLQDGGERFAYGEGTWQNLDIFIPEDAGDSADVMFFIHGGSWLFGNQTQSMTRFATTARDRGLVGVSVDYSKLGLKTTAADMAEEIYAAAEFVRDLLAGRGIEAQSLAVCGHSSGANTALLFAYKHYADSPIDISFVVAASAPVGFENYGDGTMVETGGNFLASLLAGEYIKKSEMNADNEAYASISPLMLVSPDVPPTLLIHGDKDKTVPYTGSVKLHEALENAGVKTGFVTIEDGGHFIYGNAGFDAVAVPAVEEFAAGCMN